MKKIRTSAALATNHPELISPENVSNDPLPDTQKREVEVILRVKQAEKRRIKDEIVWIQLVMDDLQSQLEEKKDEIRTLKGMISPLKHFPSEIISKVFEEYARGLSHPPWLVGHICSKWRGIALAMPHLWNKVVIRFRSSFQTCRTFDKYKVLFRRCGSRPISCTLISGTTSPFINYLLPDFAQYANRLHHLSLDGAETFIQLLRMPPGQLSSLQTLTLKFFPKNCQTIPEIAHAGERCSPITLFEKTPALRRVNITTGTYDRWINPNILPLRLPWEQLTHLFLSPNLHIGQGALSSVLNQCTSLIQCRIPVPEEDLSTISPTLIEFENLEALEIVNAPIMAGGRHSRLLRNLIFPSLKRLIIMSRGGTFFPLDDIATSISKSGCKVEIFHIRSTLNQNSVPDFIGDIPSLTELSVEGIPLLSKILGRMARGDLLPNLGFIECRSHGVFHISPDELIEALGVDGFMEPLSDDGAPLYVHILSDGGMSFGDRLGDLQRNWLNVSFQHVRGELYETEYEL